MARRSSRVNGRTARLSRSPLGRDRVVDDPIRRRGSPLDLRGDHERRRVSHLVYKAMSAAEAAPSVAAETLRRDVREAVAATARAVRRGSSADEELLRRVDQIRGWILAARIIESPIAASQDPGQTPSHRAVFTHTIADAVWSKRRL